MRSIARISNVKYNKTALPLLRGNKLSEHFVLNKYQ